MTIKDSSLFEQPLNFVHQVKEGKHIVLFYEELEYAKMISFQFIKAGLAHKKECSYLSEEEVEAVKREMTDIGVDVNKFTKNGLLHIYQVPSLPDYHPEDTQIEKKGGEGEDADSILKDPSKIGQTERIVLRCVYKI